MRYKDFLLVVTCLAVLGLTILAILALLRGDSMVFGVYVAGIVGLIIVFTRWYDGD